MCTSTASKRSRPRSMRRPRISGAPSARKPALRGLPAPDPGCAGTRVRGTAAAQFAGDWQSGAGTRRAGDVDRASGRTVPGDRVRPADPCRRRPRGRRTGDVPHLPRWAALRRVLDEVLAAGVLAVDSMGFRQVDRARGRRVQRVVDGAAGRAFLGDSGSRTWLLGEPALIRRGRERAGALVLAGSDPFPFASDHRRVGAFGFLADIEPDLTGAMAFAAGVARWPAGVAATVWAASGPVRFLINQLGVQALQPSRESTSA